MTPAPTDDARLNLQEDQRLAATRRRVLLYLNYIFWALALAFILFVANLAAALMQRWMAGLDAARHALGMAPSMGGPDWYLLIGAAAAVSIPCIAIVYGAYLYRATWHRRLNRVWPEGRSSRHARLLPMKPAATDRDLRDKAEYLNALMRSSDWQSLGITPVHDNDHQQFERAAELLLKNIEADVSARALTTGLVVGFSHNHLIDALTLAGSALELQLHVLTVLGKRPSVGSWLEMLKRTAASLFLNSYLSREDLLYLKVAIRKAAWGIEAASNLADHGRVAMDDFDWDHLDAMVPEYLRLVLHGGRLATGAMLGVGAAGLHQISAFVETSAEDLLQGVVAGGILYFHGMALAADCLALDRQHRQSQAMTRTISDGIAATYTPVAKMLRDQVRALRQALRRKNAAMMSIGKDWAQKNASSMAASAKAGKDSVVRGMKSAAGGLSGFVARPFKTSPAAECPFCEGAIQTGQQFCGKCGAAISA